MRKGFTAVHNNYYDTRSLLPSPCAMLLERLFTNSESFNPANTHLAKVMQVSERSIKRYLKVLESAGLIHREGKAIGRGHIRKITLTALAIAWLREGMEPECLQKKVRGDSCVGTPVPQIPVTSERNPQFKEKVRSDSCDQVRGDSCDTPKEKQILPKEKESKQSLPKKSALLAPPSGEVNLELPSTESEKPKRTESACNALSRDQTSNHTQNERKPRGEPKKGLPEALANKIEQYQADELWNVIDCADLTINSKIRLYEVAVKKECTPAEFKLLLDSALARNPYNLGGLLHCMLHEDIETVRRQAFIQHDLETAQARLDALHQNGLMVADWIRRAPPQFACGSLNPSKTKWIFNKTQSVTLTCSRENVLQQLTNLERTFSCKR